MLRDGVSLFGAGVASFLAPCVVPLLPAYLAVIAGEKADGDADGGGASVRATLIFVAGFALVFAVLGAIAGLIGSSLDRAQDAVQRVGGVLVIVMGLALLGVLRGRFLRERRLLGEQGPRWAWLRGPLRPFVLGVAFGAAWTPCVGPLLGAALTFAAVSGEAGRGSLLLLAYAMGIGVPFVLASLGLASSPRVAAGLRRIGPPLQKVGGVAMVVLGVLLVTGAYGHLTSYLARFSPSVAGL
ncbi:MAG: cytochrome c biogenesis CcdA family protein [Acidimicrobiales bacterium]